MTMKVLIVGGGRVGIHLASLLWEEGHRVTVIEVRPDQRPLDLPAEGWLTGNGTDPTVLEAAGIGQAGVVAAVTGADETNLVVTNLARFEFSVPRIVARVNHPRNAWLFTPEMGVDVALNQADLMAHLIAEEMSLGDMMTLLKLRTGQFDLIEEKVHPAAPAAHQAIRDLDLPQACVLTAIIRRGELIIPRGNVVLQPADEVLAVVHASQKSQLAAILGAIRETE